MAERGRETASSLSGVGAPLKALKKPETVLVIVLVLLGGIFVATSPSAWDYDSSTLLYDLGIGVLVATGVSTVVAGLVKRIDRSEERRSSAIADQIREAEKVRDDAERRRAKVELEREQRLRDLQGELNHLGSEMNAAKLGADLTILSAELFEVKMALREVHEDVRRTRMGVDDNYEHPVEAIVRSQIEKSNLFRRVDGPTRPTDDAEGSSETPTD